VAPVVPVGPATVDAAPVVPVAPVTPVVPVAPVTPVVPVAPVTPVVPVAPVTPVAPCAAIAAHWLELVSGILPVLLPASETKLPPAKLTESPTLYTVPAAQVPR
jgi:hypothetical protein